jgi:hypothetical protein
VTRTRGPLAEGLRDAFAEGAAAPWSDEAFDHWARSVFEHQFEVNVVYRRFCEGRGVTPAVVRSWRDVPAVPTSAFKHLDLTPGPVEAVFETSGTTRGRTTRGRHGVASLALYRAACMPPLAHHMALESGPVRILSLIPGPDRAPTSSLSTMMGFAVEAYGAEGSGWYADLERGIDEAGFADALARAVADEVPVWVAGTAFAFVHWLDAVSAGRGRRVRLPAGSRVMETGGFKGRSREVDKAALHEGISEVLGVPDAWIVNEYGMTELLSQYWDGVAGSSDRPPPGERVHRPPPWMRARAVDPVTLEDRPTAEPGLLLHFDLANIGSVSAILTEDRGTVDRDGRVRVLGRAPGAEPRGCSLALEDLMEVAS